MGLEQAVTIVANFELRDLLLSVFTKYLRKFDKILGR